MSLYESVMIIRQDATAQQVEGLADLFEEIITKSEGKVIKRENWGLRSLAYRIKKNRKGHYILFNLDAEPPIIQEMERQMRLNEDVLRYLTLRIDEVEEGPSIPFRMTSQSDQTAENHKDDNTATQIPEDIDNTATQIPEDINEKTDLEPETQTENNSPSKDSGEG